MSGGYFPKDGMSIEIDIDDVAMDKNFKKDCPQLARILMLLSREIARIVNQYDYHISGDSYIENMREFEEKSINNIKGISFF